MYFQGDPEKDDVFKLYPELKFVSEFKALIDEFGQKYANKLLWAICKTEDPESLLYSSRLDRRRDNVEKNYLKNEVEWDSPLIKDAVWAYKRDCMTLERKTVKVWGDKLHEANRYMDDADMEDILGGRNSPIKQYETLLNLYEKHKDKYLEAKGSEGRNVGDYKTSGNEDGRLD